MLIGAPSQLLPATRLDTVLRLVEPGRPLGVWARGGRRPLRLRSGGCALLAGADLGALLRRCALIAVRCKGSVVVARAEELIAWRTLQIVTGAPCLPEIDRLRSLVPGLEVSRNAARRPTRSRQPGGSDGLVRGGEGAGRRELDRLSRLTPEQRCL